MNRTCVKCTSVLDKASVGDVEVDLCPSCGGLWLDAGELEKIGKASDDDVSKLRQSLGGSTAPEGASDTQSSCPACPGQLNEVSLGPVRIEYCTSCAGLFLDRGELDQALAATKGLTIQQVFAVAGRVTGELRAVSGGAS
jgi:Zn-finger nucleic acid-binding protein